VAGFSPIASPTTVEKGTKGETFMATNQQDSRKRANAGGSSPSSPRIHSRGHGRYGDHHVYAHHAQQGGNSHYGLYGKIPGQIVQCSSADPMASFSGV
jgi:hypothetical protein